MFSLVRSTEMHSVSSRLRFRHTSSETLTFWIGNQIATIYGSGSMSPCIVTRVWNVSSSGTINVGPSVPICWGSILVRALSSTCVALIHELRLGYPSVDALGVPRVRMGIERRIQFQVTRSHRGHLTLLVEIWRKIYLPRIEWPLLQIRSGGKQLI